ncbi:MAG: ATP-dependent DNA helicase RecQ [Deltaproteobacteria bacterium]|nr:ATP-dependent DNA helicase RecQ [Deltaproteobacteria bacterium]
MDLNGSLERFGLEKFRPGQREAVETLLRVGKLLLVAPTGGGKSLVYQLPAAGLPGTSLIVSPLVSLMQDQVSALEAVGVPATFLAATLDSGELRHRMRELGRGSYKLAYVAPERLAFDGFRSLLADLDCPLIAVDEAHCISEWGHDFRPEYMQIGEVITAIPDARVLACTATATPVVRDEILARLGLPADTPQLVRGFARPNLALGAREVASKRDKNASVDAALRDAVGSPGQVEGCAIVYAPTRKSTEQEAERLARAGYRAEAYHAGLRGAVREAVHGRFSAGKTEVVVATNAFGMGIDRSDVRAVVHLAPPSSIEAYYQEVGRAGRDGEPAIGQLLVSAGDLPLRRRLIESDANGVSADPEIVRHKWNLFLELMRWAEGGSCRHDAILRYFGDEEETLAGCGRCDVCLDLVARGEADEETVTLVVRKALSGVARVHGRFGLQTAAKLLHGSPDERLANTRLDQTPTFGALSERAELWITKLLRRCVTAGWIDFIGGDRPVVVLTEEGVRVMRAELPARLVLPAAGAPKPLGRTPAGSATGRKAAAGRAAAVPDALDEAGEALFEALRHHRLEVARAAGIPPYVVASDRTLRDLALLHPRNREELLLAHGIGPAKADRFGKGLLEIINK